MSIKDQNIMAELLSKKPLDADRLVAFLYSDTRAKGIIRRIVSKKSVGYADIDELFQRSLMALFEPSKRGNSRIIDNIENNIDGFYSLWYRISEIVTLNYTKEIHRHEQFEDDEHEENLIQEASLNIEAEHNMEDKIAKKLAFERFNSIFDKSSDKIKGIVDKVVDAPVSGKKRGRPSQSSKSTNEAVDTNDSNEIIPVVDQFEGMTLDDKSAREKLILEAKRLSEIRVALGVTMEEYALKLGLPEFRLVSYIYRRVKKVPEGLVAQAETLLASEGGTVAAIQAIESMSMDGIVERWRRAIPNDQDLCEILNVSNVTLGRWAEGDTRPHIAKIRRYNQLVVAATKKISETLKKEKAKLIIY